MAKKKTRKFKTEVQQLLDLVIHSLYTKKEIYLRELLSNASDAIDRLHYEALTDKSLMEKDHQGKVSVDVDKDAKTITITDNGIGMSADEVESNIGTIASSGTRRFLESLQEAKEAGAEDAPFIGQFGVGFYSAFMVADKVSVVTKRAGKDQAAVRWTSKGAGSYTLEEAEKASHGTEITLYLREEMDEYLEEWQIKKTVKQYSDYISYPIVMEVERTVPAEEEGEEPSKKIEEETLNSMQAIWKKSKNDITEDEHKEFYKHISHDFTDPAETIHFVGEGVTEFRALLYIPSKAPFDLYMREERRGLQLYVKNVFISDDCKELLPDYLRFVKGVVDSSDLPLNVSREMLQDDAVIRRIRKGLVGRIIRTLNEMRDKDREKYQSFWEEFGKVVKEGVHFDFENREKLQDLMLFYSTKTEEGKPTLLKEYVERMPEDQDAIYYATGDTLDVVKSSPHLEVFNTKGYEVLFFTDPIDEWVIQAVTNYDDKPLKAIDRGDIDLDSEEEKEAKKGEREEAEKEYKHLLEHIQELLKEEIKEVRLSSRLTDSACCLVADEQGMNAHMERLLQAMNQEFQATKRILELNPDHAVLPIMKDLLVKKETEGRLADYVELLYNQALLTEGSPIKDPLRFTKLVSELMVSAK